MKITLTPDHALWAFTLAIWCSISGCSKNSGSNSGTPTGPGKTQLSISAISPASGPDSTTVDITGTGFSTTPSDDIVKFNGKQAAVLSASATQLTVRVPTLAGKGIVTATINGVTANGPNFTYDTTWSATILATGFIDPQFVSADANGNLYLTAWGGFGNLFKVTPQGDTSTIASPLPAAEGTSIDQAGNIYTVSHLPPQQPTFYQFASGGTATVIGTDSGEIEGLAIDANGNIFAANQQNKTIDKITPQGAVSIFASNLPNLAGLAFDASGNLFATSSNNAYNETAGVIYKFTPDGNRTTVCSGLMLSVQDGIAIDKNDNLYVTCYSPYFSTSSVVRISPSGIVTTLTTSFHIPLGITLDANGTLYVIEEDPIAQTYGNVSRLTYH